VNRVLDSQPLARTFQSNIHHVPIRKYVQVLGNPTGGKLLLQYGGVLSDPINYPVTDVAEVLQAIDDIYPGQVTVTREGDTFYFDFLDGYQPGFGVASRLLGSAVVLVGTGQPA
jgi:hypothetical protein